MRYNCVYIIILIVRVVFNAPTNTILVISELG